TNPDVARSVRQFHYTAWPDKDVPDSPASLLMFWHTVRAYDPQRVAPWLSQYKFLHEVMYEALVLSSWPVPVDEFPNEHQRLVKVDPVLNKTNILLEYENEKAYQTMVFSKIRLDSYGQEMDVFSIASLPENVSKNRSQSTLFERYAFVVSQTPLEETLVDLCRLIHDLDIRIVVSFPDEGREQVGKLPTSGSSTIGPFTVRFEKEKTSDSIIHRKYSLTNKTGEQFQFCHDVALDHANARETCDNV
ncbi:PTPRT-like protein, partial [Mya arenaria]